MKHFVPRSASRLAVAASVPPKRMSGRPSVSLVVSLLALFVALGGWGYAATGGSLVLGKTSRSPRTTGLASGAKHAPTLAVTNTGGGTAASFNARAGVPPFKVNSSAPVAKLNADLLDGLDGSALQRRVAGTCAAGSAIRIVRADGTVTCQSTGGGGGTAPTGTPAAPPPAWNLGGNKSTKPGTDFLGTRDAQDLVLKTNNIERLRIDASGKVGIIGDLGLSGDVGLGTAATNDARLRVSAPSAVASGAAVIGTGGAGTAVVGRATTGDGVLGNSSVARGVIGTLGGTPCAGTYAVGGCGATIGFGVFGSSSATAGVFGSSPTAGGVLGRAGSSTCPGPLVTHFAVGGCGDAASDGVVAWNNAPFNGPTVAAFHAIETHAGDLFLGQQGAGARVARIDDVGKGYFNGGTQTGGADYAESMRTSDARATLEPGDVLAIDPRHVHAVQKSRAANSPLVAGVYSTKPTILAVGDHGLDDSLAGEVPVAMLGIVPTKVSAENGPVQTGDLLTTASTPGYAMKVSATKVAGTVVYPTGTILGKALEPLAKGMGVIEVLVTLR